MFAFYQPYFESVNIQIEQFGILYAIISSFSAIGALSITGIAKKRHSTKILLFMMMSLLFTLVIMLLKLPAFVYIAIVPSAIAFGFVMTLQNTITQKLISSRHQATALSIVSFVQTFAFLVGVIALGVSLDFLNAQSVNVVLAMLTAAFTLPFVVGLVHRATP